MDIHSLGQIQYGQVALLARIETQGLFAGKFPSAASESPSGSPFLRSWRPLH